MKTGGGPVLGHKRNAIYIACEEMDFIWAESDLMMFRHLWNKGESILDIAAYFKRDPDEVGLLIIDQARQDLIKPRRDGTNEIRRNRPKRSNRDGNLG